MADFISPFRPAGPMLSLLGSSTNANAATLMPMSGDNSYLFFNRSPATDAYLVYGPNSGVIASTVLPVVGAAPPPTGGPNLLPLPFRSMVKFTFSGPTFFGIIVNGAGNAIVDIAPGDGE